jgi:antitoxin YefM
MSTLHETTYTQARATLAALCDQVTSTREPVLIRRRAAEDVALISASELGGLLETAHLLRSPVNADRLLTALSRAQDGIVEPMSIAELREAVGLGEK